MELIIGDMSVATWSLRAWLVLKRCGAEFTLREIPMSGPESAPALAAHSPSGKVPVLKVDGVAIWDSLAISVFAAERYPEAKLWPVDAHARWLARSVACEMHSGFSALRSECATGVDAAGVVHTMVGPDRAPAPTSDTVAAEVRRFVAIVQEMRERFAAGGPYLFGEWSMPDAFFTPLAARLRHYQIELAAHGDESGVAATYVAALLQQPDFLEWAELAVTVRP